MGGKNAQNLIWEYNKNLKSMQVEKCKRKGLKRKQYE